MKKTEKIHINMNYGSSVAVLPQSALAFIDKAKKFDIKVLFLIASSDKYRNGKYEQLIADELSCEVNDVQSSIAFWNGTGIISLGDGVEAPKIVSKPENNVPKRAKVTELPQYTSAELNALLQKHNNVVGLIDECQNVLGKIFTAADIKVLMGFVDYLGLDNDYILVLIHFDLLVAVRSAILDGLHNWETFNYAPAHTIALDVLIQISDLFTSPYLSKWNIVQSGNYTLHTNLL